MKILGKLFAISLVLMLALVSFAPAYAEQNFVISDIDYDDPYGPALTVGWTAKLCVPGGVAVAHSSDFPPQGSCGDLSPRKSDRRR